MIRALRRWFARTDVRLEPRTISGREVSFTDGYSLLELERAGISEAQAAAAGLTIDRDAHRPSDRTSWSSKGFAGRVDFRPADKSESGSRTYPRTRPA